MNDGAYAATIAVAEESGTVTITGGGSLDFTNAEAFREALAGAAGQAGGVVVDLVSAVFIDTAILEYLARAAKAMLGRGKRLRVLAASHSHPLRVLRISSFDDLMDIEVNPADQEN